MKLKFTKDGQICNATGILNSFLATANQSDLRSFYKSKKFNYKVKLKIKDAVKIDDKVVWGSVLAQITLSKHNDNKRARYDFVLQTCVGSTPASSTLTHKKTNKFNCIDFVPASVYDNPKQLTGGFDDILKTLEAALTNG